MRSPSQAVSSSRRRCAGGFGGLSSAICRGFHRDEMGLGSFDERRQLSCLRPERVWPVTGQCLDQQVSVNRDFSAAVDQPSPCGLNRGHGHLSVKRITRCRRLNLSGADGVYGAVRNLHHVVETDHQLYDIRRKNQHLDLQPLERVSLRKVRELGDYSRLECSDPANNGSAAGIEQHPTDSNASIFSSRGLRLFGDLPSLGLVLKLLLPQLDWLIDRPSESECGDTDGSPVTCVSELKHCAERRTSNDLYGHQSVPLDRSLVPTSRIAAWHGGGQ